MSLELLRMVKELKKRCDDLEAWKAEMTLQAKVSEPEEPKPGRKMCPKCGVKPDHFFHVKNCTGKQEEQKDAGTDRPGSNTTT